MSEPAEEELLLAGTITGCYGVKGWVKVHAYTEPRENFLQFGEWLLKRRDGLEPIEFDQGRAHGRGLVAHIAGVDDRNAAEAYRGLDVLVPRQLLPALEEGDYYWSQLQGLQVWCGNSGNKCGNKDAPRVLLGVVDHLLETGANDVLVVRPCEGSIDERERLIPYLPGNVVTRVDLAEQVMEVDWFPDA